MRGLGRSGRGYGGGRLSGLLGSGGILCRLSRGGAILDHGEYIPNQYGVPGVSRSRHDFAAARRGNRQGGLVRLHVDQRFVLLNRVSGFDVPLEDLAFVNAFAKVG